MFARFDENPAMTLRVIKETKRYGRTDNVKTVYPLQTKFAGGIIIPFIVYIIHIHSCNTKIIFTNKLHSVLFYHTTILLFSGEKNPHTNPLGQLIEFWVYIALRLMWKAVLQTCMLI